MKHKKNIILKVTVILFFLVLSSIIYSCQSILNLQNKTSKLSEILEIEKLRVMKYADIFLKESPITITVSSSPRSTGGKHDYFSEGDYWWPDTNNPNGPYIQKDGMTNPDNFVAHRKAMIRFSIQSATLTSAYILTRDTKYSNKAIEHFKAWFVDDETKMNPNLLYAQAIKGRFTGRGIGIIDAIHLIEVARSIIILEKDRIINIEDLSKIKKWFSDFLYWLTTHQYGKDEMNAKNNHGTCWVMQVAAFAQFVGDKKKIEFCRNRFKEILIPNQMANDGSFPLELNRTKPYNYSLFNLDAMATICQILSDSSNNLWEFTLLDGRSIRKGIDFIYPYILDKKKWKYKPDVMFFDFYPVRHPSLLFGSMAYNDKKYFELWKNLNPDPENEEVIRNFPIREPLLWIVNIN